MLCNDIAEVEKAIEQEDEPNVLVDHRHSTRDETVRENIKHANKHIPTRMKQRKEAKKENTKKKAKTYIVEEDQKNPYDLEKVLEALGEVSNN